MQRTDALARTVMPKPAPPAPETARPCAGVARPALPSSESVTMLTVVTVCAPFTVTGRVAYTDGGREITLGRTCISLCLVLLSSVLHYKPRPPAQKSEFTNMK